MNHFILIDKFGKSKYVFLVCFFCLCCAFNIISYFNFIVLYKVKKKQIIY